MTASDVAITSDLSSNDSITVHAKSVAPGFFSKLFGINTVNVGASATARAGFASQALYVAPMVVSKYHPLLAGSGCPVLQARDDARLRQGWARRAPSEC